MIMIRCLRQPYTPTVPLFDVWARRSRILAPFLLPCFPFLVSSSTSVDFLNMSIKRQHTHAGNDTKTKLSLNVKERAFLHRLHSGQYSHREMMRSFFKDQSFKGTVFSADFSKIFCQSIMKFMWYDLKKPGASYSYNGPMCQVCQIIFTLGQPITDQFNQFIQLWIQKDYSNGSPKIENSKLYVSCVIILLKFPNLHLNPESIGLLKGRLIKCLPKKTDGVSLFLWTCADCKENPLARELLADQQIVDCWLEATSKQASGASEMFLRQCLETVTKVKLSVSDKWCKSIAISLLGLKFNKVPTANLILSSMADHHFVVESEMKKKLLQHSFRRLFEIEPLDKSKPWTIASVIYQAALMDIDPVCAIEDFWSEQFWEKTKTMDFYEKQRNRLILAISKLKVTPPDHWIKKVCPEEVSMFRSHRAEEQLLTIRAINKDTKQNEMKNLTETWLAGIDERTKTADLVENVRSISLLKIELNEQLWNSLWSKSILLADRLNPTQMQMILVALKRINIEPPINWLSHMIEGAIGGTHKDDKKACGILLKMNKTQLKQLADYDNDILLRLVRLSINSGNFNEGEMVDFLKILSEIGPKQLEPEQRLLVLDAIIKDIDIRLPLFWLQSFVDAFETNIEVNLTIQLLPLLATLIKRVKQLELKGNVLSCLIRSLHGSIESLKVETLFDMLRLVSFADRFNSNLTNSFPRSFWNCIYENLNDFTVEQCETILIAIGVLRRGPSPALVQSLIGRIDPQKCRNSFDLLTSLLYLARKKDYISVRFSENFIRDLFKDLETKFQNSRPASISYIGRSLCTFRSAASTLPDEFWDNFWKSTTRLFDSFTNVHRVALLNTMIMFPEHCPTVGYFDQFISKFKLDDKPKESSNCLILINSLQEQFKQSLPVELTNYWVQSFCSRVKNMEENKVVQVLRTITDLNIEPGLLPIPLMHRIELVKAIISFNIHVRTSWLGQLINSMILPKNSSLQDSTALLYILQVVRRMFPFLRINEQVTDSVVFPLLSQMDTLSIEQFMSLIRFCSQNSVYVDSGFWSKFWSISSKILPSLDATGRLLLLKAVLDLKGKPTADWLQSVIIGIKSSDVDSNAAFAIKHFMNKCGLFSNTNTTTKFVGTAIGRSLAHRLRTGLETGLSEFWPKCEQLASQLSSRQKIDLLKLVLVELKVDPPINWLIRLLNGTEPDDALHAGLLIIALSKLPDIFLSNQRMAQTVANEKGLRFLLEMCCCEMKLIQPDCLVKLPHAVYCLNVDLAQWTPSFWSNFWDAIEPIIDSLSVDDHLFLINSAKLYEQQPPPFCNESLMKKDKFL